jgi:predicted nucleotidyltransferase
MEMCRSSVQRAVSSCRRASAIERESPRLSWVRQSAAALIAIAERHGARELCLCGSVARRTDGDDSDIDFYVRGFDDGGSPLERLEARQRADALVEEIRSLAPYQVDVRGIPGWLLDGEFEKSMQRDAIPLTEFLT